MEVMGVGRGLLVGVGVGVGGGVGVRREEGEGRVPPSAASSLKPRLQARSSLQHRPARLAGLLCFFLGLFSSDYKNYGCSLYIIKKM